MNKHKPENQESEPMFDLLTNLDVPRRDPARTERGRALFLKQAQELAQTVSHSAESRHKEWINPISMIFGKETILKMNKLGIALVMVFVLLAGTGMTVYASQSSLPGDFLYPVKLASEETVALVSTEPEDAMALNLKLAERRMTEFMLLQGQGVIPPESLHLALENHLELAFQAVSQLDAPVMASTQFHLQQQFRSQLEQLTALQAPHDPQALANLTRLQERLQECVYFAELPADQFRSQLITQQRDRETIRLQLTDSPEPDGGFGPGPLATGVPVGEGGYGPLGSPEATPGSGDGYGPGPYITGTPTPGSGYGPGPGPESTENAGGPYGTGGDDPNGDGYGPGGEGAPEEPPKGNGK